MLPFNLFNYQKLDGEIIKNKNKQTSKLQTDTNGMEIKFYNFFLIL